MSVKKLLVIVVVGAVALFTVVGAAGGGLPQLIVDPPPMDPVEEQTGEVVGADEDDAQAPPRQPAQIPRPDPADPASIVTERQAILLLNPATVTAGGAVNVSGSGFTPGATVNMLLKRDRSDKGEDLGFVQADQSGSFGGFSFLLSEEFAGRTFLVVATQRDGAREAIAEGNAAAGSPVVRFGTQVGKPGDVVTFSATGFVAGEELSVHFNSLSSEPVSVFRADPGGGLRQATIRVPFGAVGNNAFIFIGEKSQSPVTMPFLMLNLYPNATVSSYAAKADTPLSFTGEGFGPGERVSVHLNNPAAPPVSVFETDDTGAFANAGAFLIPFDLKGQNTFILRGERSQAAATVSFDVLPYAPYAEPSTYGGRPGTTVTFYGSGFARDEIVRVFAGVTHDNPGREVACFQADDRGDVRGGGSYTVPGNAQSGTLQFRLIGDRSGGVATAAIEVMDAGGPLQSQVEQQPYVCQFDQPEQQESQQPAPAAGSEEQPPVQQQPAPAAGEEAAPSADESLEQMSPPAGETQAQEEETPLADETDASEEEAPPADEADESEEENEPQQ